MLNITKFFNGLNIIPRSDGATAPNAEGDLAVSSADGRLYYYNGSAIVTFTMTTTPGQITGQEIIVSGPGANSFNDGTDLTKEILFNAASAATATTLTLQDNQTTSQTLNFPNIIATDTLVSQALVQTLTNKTISGSSNTLSNIAFSSLAPLSSANILVGNGSNVAASVPVTGDISLSNAGVTELLSIQSIPVSAASPTNGQVLTYNGTNWVPLTPSPGFANPMTSVGDMIVGGTSGSPLRLAATTNGYILTLVSGTPAWVANSGGAAPTSIGPLDGGGVSAAGLVLSSNVLYAQSASNTAPGMVNTGSQTFGGIKTFSNGLVTPSIIDPGSGLIIGSTNNNNLTLTTTGTGRLIANTVNGIDLPQVVTPADPASGYNSLYFKTTGPSRETTIVQIPSSNPASINNTSTSDFVGNSFTPLTNTTLNTVTFTLDYITGSGPIGTLDVKICADSAGNPGSVLQSSANINVATLTSTPATYTFTFSGLALTASTKYHALLDMTGVSSFGGGAIQFYVNTSSSYSGGNVEYSTNGGGSWTQLSGNDAWMTINGITTAPDNNLYTLDSTGDETQVGSNLSEPITMLEVSTPSNPSSGYLKVYPKSDDNLYTLNSSGVEKLVGGNGIASNYAQAYFGSASSWSTTNASYTDGTNSGGNSLTVRKSSGITLTAAGSNLCGVTFTPASSSAIYFVMATVGLSTSVLGDGAGYLLTDGTTTISNPAQYDSNSGEQTPVPLNGIYAPGTTSPVTIKIQVYAAGGGTATISGAGGSSGSAVEWTVIQLPGTDSANGFKFYASSQVTTDSSAITSGTFTTFSNSPALTFTPTITGKYKVYSTIPLFTTLTSDEGIARIVNTSGGATLLYESQACCYGSASSNLAGSTAQSVYTLTSGTAYQFDIQGKALGSNPSLEALGGDVSFYIFAELCG